MKNFKDYLENFGGQKTLMVIYPHPDDETMAAGGLLLIAKKLGWKTIVVTLTKGGAGKMHIHPNGNSTKEIRENELAKAGKILGVSELISWDFDDAKLREQEGSWAPKVLEVIKKYQPGIVVTYDPTGISGHMDHITLSIGLKKLVSEIRKPPELFWTTASDFVKNRTVREELRELLVEPEYQLDLGLLEWQAKWRAARAHKSQALGSGRGVPLGILLLWQHFEWYHKVDLKKEYPFKYVDFKI